MRPTRVNQASDGALAGDVLSPLPLPEATFESIGMNYLLHCQPGAIESKARAHRVFSNTTDSLEGLQVALEDRFVDVVVRRCGCVALFSARAPRVHQSST